MILEPSIIIYSPIDLPSKQKDLLYQHGTLKFPKNIQELKEALSTSLSPFLVIDMFLNDCKGQTTGSIELINEIKNESEEIPIMIFSSVLANEYAIQVVKNSGAEIYSHVEELGKTFSEWLKREILEKAA